MLGIMYIFVTVFCLVFHIQENDSLPFAENASSYDINNIDLLASGLNGKPLELDFLTQLLNQETLIRMTLTKNVNSIMDDMVSLKEDINMLTRKLADVLEKAETEKTATDRELTAIKLENKKLKESISRIDRELSLHNFTDIELQKDLDSYKAEVQMYEKRTETLRESFEENTTALVSTIYNHVHVLSMSVIKVDEHSQELSQRMDSMNKAIPEMIEDKISYVLDLTKNLTQKLSESDRNQLKRMRNEIERTKQNQLEMSAMVLHMEWQRDNETSKCDSQNRLTAAFTAGFTSSSYQSSGILIFNNVIYNIGGGYDPTSGKFIAPSSGVYVFYVSITSYEYRYIKARIHLNGDAKVTIRANGPHENAYYQTGTNMVILSLLSGDKVWVQWEAGTGFSSYSVPLTTFSGFMI